MRVRHDAVLVGVLLAIAIAPGLMVDIPAMADYPNHLARMHLLASDLAGERNPFYEVTWKLYPNLGMDLLVPQIARVMGVELATRSFFIFVQCLLVAGAIAIELAVKRKHELAGFAALPALHSLPFSLGLVNFEFGLALALWGIAIWIRMSDSGPLLRLAIHSCFVAAIFVAHFFALGIYGATIGLIELHRLLAKRGGIRDVLLTTGLLAGPAAAMLCVMILTGGAVGGSGAEWRLAWKPVWPFLALNGYNVHLATAIAAVLIFGAAILSFKGKLHLSAPGTWLAAGFLVLYVAMPFRIVDTKLVDIRVIVAALIIIPAFVSVDHWTPLRTVLAAVVATIVVINSVLVGQIWREYDAEYSAMKSSFAQLRHGSTVLVGHDAADASSVLLDAPIVRAPTLAVHYAGALVSSLYTVPGMQPVELRREFQMFDIDVATEGYETPSIALLQTTAKDHGPQNAPAYLRHWADRFDYLYLVGRPISNPLPHLLEELAIGKRFVLYRIKK